MTCQGVDRENVIERYIAGRLDTREKEDWEQHYFGCERCAAQLETCLAVKEPLRAMAPEIRRELPPARRIATWMWLAAAAATVLIGLAAVRFAGQPAPPVAQLAGLARFEPPTYSPPVLRGVESKLEAQFREAMVAYSRRDYRQAITGLHSALALDPGSDAARFFLGACYLLTGDAASGTRELRAVAAGHSPFASEAAYDLAKGYLQQGDKATALQVLRRIADGNGEFSENARHLIHQIEEVR
jgi:tetratricopeptide (TPR) repeat protein